ncbi:MAG: hypothetical protein EOP45_05880 [Sphingobacteriaceae bacterium]|nr:MAG: hypothetical protein EOP45_05880 [Sphingobacteriaceae bacterium]
MILKVIFFLSIVVGLCLYGYSTQLDYYTNPEAKEKLDSEAGSNLDLVQDKQWKQHYYAETDKLKTEKLFFEDLGSGLAIASATVLLFLLLKRVSSFTDLLLLQTMTRRQVLIFSNLIWLVMFPATWWYYTYRAERGDYPWFADTVIIPIMEQTLTYLIAFIPLNLFIWLTSIDSRLPTYVFIKPNSYDGREIMKEIFWSLWLLLNLLLLYGFIKDGDHLAIPVNLFFTFVLLNLRAGQVKISVDQLATN